MLAEEALDRFQQPLVAFHGGAHQLHFRSRLTRPAAFLDGARTNRVGRRLAQVKLDIRAGDANLGVAPGNVHVAFARHNRNGHKHLLEKLLLVGPDFRAGLLQQRDMLAFDDEHALARRKEHARGDLQARIHVHDRVDAVGFLLGVDLAGEGLFLALFGGFGFGRGVPVDEGRGNLFPSAPLDAVVTHAVALSFVAAHELEGAVLQHELLAARQGVFVLLVGLVLIGALAGGRLSGNILSQRQRA